MLIPSVIFVEIFWNWLSLSGIYQNSYSFRLKQHIL